MKTAAIHPLAAGSSLSPRMFGRAAGAALLLLFSFAGAHAASNTPNNLATGTELATPANWSLGSSPTVAHDAVLSATGVTGYTFSGAASLTVGSLDYQGAFASTLGNATAATTSTLTLGGAGNLGNSLAAASPSDLLFVRTGGTLTLQNGAGLLKLALGQDGTVNTPGTLNLSVPVSGAFGFTKTGSGTTTLAAANSYTGSTTVSGPLTLDFSLASSPATGGIVKNSATDIASASPLVLRGGTLALKGKGGAANTQFFSGTTLNPGGSRITLTQNSATTLTVALGPIARNAGAALNFSTAPSTTGIIATTTSLNDANSLLGPWATVGTGTALQYATVNGSAQIVAYAGATADAGNLTSLTNPAVNYSYGAAATSTANAVANTLRYTGAGTTTALGTNTLTLNGLLNAGSGALAISGTAPGGVVVGDKKELVLAAAGQNITITAPIANASAGASSVLVTGSSEIQLGAANAFSGGLTVANPVSGGRVRATTGSSTVFGTGTITLAGGGSVIGTGAQNLYATGGVLTLANNFVIVTGTQNRFEFSVSSSTPWAINGSITGGGLFALSSGFNPTLQLGGNVTGFTGTLQLQGNGAGNAATTNYDFANTVTIGAPAARVQLAPGINGTTATNLALLRWNPSTATSATIPLGELTSVISSPQTSANAILTNAKAATTATWQIGALNTTATFSGNITANSAAPTALTALEKVGTGILTLDGTASTYTGSTTVTAGTLLVNGIHNQGTGVNAGRYLVASGATLGGTGTIALSDTTGTLTGIAISGTLAPGDAAVASGIGTLTLDGAASARPVLSLAAGATLAFDLNFVAGADTSDCVAISNPQAGDVVFTGNTINFTDRSGATLNLNEQVTLFRGNAAGTFSGLTVDGGGNITAGLVVGTLPPAYSRSKLKVSGNDIVLVVLPVAKPAITSPTAASGRDGSAFSYQIVATNGPTSFAASGLPSGLSVNPTTGLISGTANSVATTIATISATNSDGTDTKNLTITIDPAGAPVITSATTASGTVGSAFAGYQIVASKSPTLYGASGLPSGLGIDSATGLISGTPNTSGTFTVILSASTAADGTGTATLVLTIAAVPPVISSALNASTPIGLPYAYTITANFEPRAFDATGLPPGLVVDKTTGVISGTPTVLGTYGVTLQASNTAGADSALLTLKVLPPAPILTTVTYLSRALNLPASFQVTGTNNPTSFSATGLPAGLSIDPATGLISGTPTVAGKSTVTLTATNAGGTGTATLTLVISTKFNAHPGLPLTASDLDTLKANLTTEPWKSAYALLVADSHSKTSYTMQGPFASVSRTPDVNLGQYRNDMQAVYNLARLWYFTADPSYAQKARDILIAWATTHTIWTGLESYLTMGDYAYRMYGGADILRGTWPGWTQSDTDLCKAYFNNVYWAHNWIAVPDPLRSANQGIEQLITGVGVAVFNDDDEKLTQCLQTFRADAVGALANSLPNGQVGDSGRDQSHAFGQILHLAWCAEVFWKQGVDVYSDLSNRLLAIGEYYSRYNLGVSTAYVPFGTKYDYYWTGHGGLPNSGNGSLDGLNLIYSAYVTRQGLSAPYIKQYRDTRTDDGDSFVFRKSADTSTATPPAPLTAPAPTASVTTGFLDADIGTAVPAGGSAYGNGTWTVNGAGTDIWSATDSYHFTYRQFTGDFTFVARVTSLASTVGKAGLVMRDSLAANAPRRIYFGYSPGGTAPLIESHQRGYTANSHNDPDESTHDGPTPMLPHWLKIQRIGTRITVFHSPDGGSWTPLQNAEYAGWNDAAYVGLSVCSKVNGTLTTATFTDVRFTGGDGLEADKLPLAPSTLYGSPGAGQVPLRWMESYGATTYNLKRSTVSGGPYTPVASLAVPSYVDTGLSGGTTYFYVVSASNAVGESGNSPEIAVVPAAGPPVISSPLAATGALGSAFGYTIAASNTPTSFAATALPAGLALDPATGVISGTPTVMGSFNVTLSATNALGTGNAFLALTVSGQTYASWAAARGLTAANNAPAADPDGDGVPNQLEHILGLDPLAPDSGRLPTETIESGQWVFRFAHDKTAAAAFAVEKSTDLLAWSPLATAIESATATTESLVAQLPLSAPKQFVRLTSAGVSTIPVGYLNKTLPAAATTAFGLPLDDTSATPIGLRAAKIESFTATTITHSAGGWTGNLANPAAPWALRLTSGAAAGKLLDLSANTATTLTLSGAALDTLGVAAGDTFELIPLDTLGTLFGATTFQGGNSAATADVVQLRSGTVWIPFYYDTGLGFWRRTSGTAANANDTIIRPGAGMLILRRGGALPLTFHGRVLGTAFRPAVNNASTTALTTGFPMDTTLAGLGLQNLLTGWRAGITTAAADAVALYSGTAWVPYLFNGANWQTAAGANSDAVSLPAGTVLLIQRPGATAGTTDLIYLKPY